MDFSSYLPEVILVVFDSKVELFDPFEPLSYELKLVDFGGVYRSLTCI